MIEEYFRQPYQVYFINPLANYLQTKVTPNQITVLSGVLGLLVLPTLLMNYVYFSIFLLILSGICDTLDGTLARMQQTSSDWGSVLDIICDRIVEITVVLSLFAIAPAERGAPALLMLASMLLCITSFLVVGIFTVNETHKSFHYSPGLMERAEAFIFFIAMMLWPHYFNFLAFLFIALVLLTAIIRLMQFHSQYRLI
ncbi:MAG TPA: CDP-alcohol phosphatidyltransferase family protein [Legionella sp.]|nr:CDP-alcohol phosphatidyltransferase family protein [Legionella sp.]